MTPNDWSNSSPGMSVAGIVLDHEFAKMQANTSKSVQAQ
jgi:hypothetical protein